MEEVMPLYCHKQQRIDRYKQFLIPKTYDNEKAEY